MRLPTLYTAAFQVQLDCVISHHPGGVDWLSVSRNLLYGFIDHIHLCQLNLERIYDGLNPAPVVIEAPTFAIIDFTVFNYR